MTRLENRAREILAIAGITVNGKAPYDIQIHDDAVYRRAFGHGSIGIGEAYMDGQWDVEDLSAFFARVSRARLDKKLYNLSTLLHAIRARITNLQNRSRAIEVAEQHYDLGNDLYEATLGRTLSYTCGYWKHAKNLDEAQDAKLDLICRKIGLKPGQTVLDIGCGWGGFLKFAAEKYGAKGVGITISKEQAVLARKTCKGLPIEIRVEDYRDTQGQFDHVVAIGMFEHVGPHNYRAFMQKVSSLLKDDGLFLLHTIGAHYTVYAADRWITKYIFPNGTLPSVAQIGEAIDRVFILEDWHNFGPDYDKTLMAWFENFDRAWPQLEAKYGKRFYRMWKYYLLSCAGMFRSRYTQLWQIVLSKKGIEGGCTSVR